MEIHEEFNVNIGENSHNLTYFPPLDIIFVSGNNSIKIVEGLSGLINNKIIVPKEKGNDVNSKIELLGKEKLIFSVSNKVNCRSKFNDTFLLDSIFQEFQDDENREIILDLPIAEAQLFVSTLLNRDNLWLSKDNCALKLSMPIEEIENNTSSSKWQIVSITCQWKLLNQWCRLCMENLKENSPVISLFSFIMYRLNNLNFSENEIRCSIMYRNRELMNIEAYRFLSFENWPHESYKYATPELMSKVGFYHYPRRANDDRAMCFLCNICLITWESTDEPWSEHQRHSPTCPLFKTDYTTNVPISLTESAMTAQKQSSNEKIKLIAKTIGNRYFATIDYRNHVTIWDGCYLLRKISEFDLPDYSTDGKVSVESAFFIETGLLSSEQCNTQPSNENNDPSNNNIKPTYKFHLVVLMKFIPDWSTMHLVIDRIPLDSSPNNPLLFAVLLDVPCSFQLVAADEMNNSIGNADVVMENSLQFESMESFENPNIDESNSFLPATFEELYNDTTNDDKEEFLKQLNIDDAWHESTEYLASLEFPKPCVEDDNSVDKPLIKLPIQYRDLGTSSIVKLININELVFPESVTVTSETLNVKSINILNVDTCEALLTFNINHVFIINISVDCPGSMKTAIALMRYGVSGSPESADLSCIYLLRLDQSIECLTQINMDLLDSNCSESSSSSSSSSIVTNIAPSSLDLLPSTQTQESTDNQSIQLLCCTSSGHTQFHMINIDLCMSSANDTLHNYDTESFDKYSSKINVVLNNSTTNTTSNVIRAAPCDLLIFPEMDRMVILMDNGTLQFFSLSAVKSSSKRQHELKQNQLSSRDCEDSISLLPTIPPPSQILMLVDQPNVLTKADSLGLLCDFIKSEWITSRIKLSYNCHWVESALTDIRHLDSTYSTTEIIRNTPGSKTSITTPSLNNCDIYDYMLAQPSQFAEGESGFVSPNKIKHPITKSCASSPIGSFTPSFGPSRTLTFRNSMNCPREHVFEFSTIKQLLLSHILLKFRVNPSLLSSQLVYVTLLRQQKSIIICNSKDSPSNNQENNTKASVTATVSNNSSKLADEISGEYQMKSHSTTGLNPPSVARGAACIESNIIINDLDAPYIDDDFVNLHEDNDSYQVSSELLRKLNAEVIAGPYVLNKHCIIDSRFITLSMTSAELVKLKSRHYAVHLCIKPINKDKNESSLDQLKFPIKSISVSLKRFSKLISHNERSQRLAILRSGNFHHNLLRVICQMDSHGSVPVQLSLLQCLDLLNWIVIMYLNDLKPQHNEKIQKLLKTLSCYVDSLISLYLLKGERDISKFITKILIGIINLERRSMITGNRIPELSQLILNSLQTKLNQIYQINNPTCLQNYLMLLNWLNYQHHQISSVVSHNNGETEFDTETSDVTMSSVIHNSYTQRLEILQSISNQFAQINNNPINICMKKILGYEHNPMTDELFDLVDDSLLNQSTTIINNIDNNNLYSNYCDVIQRPQALSAADMFNIKNKIGYKSKQHQNSSSSIMPMKNITHISNKIVGEATTKADSTYDKDDLKSDFTVLQDLKRAYQKMMISNILSDFTQINVKMTQDSIKPKNNGAKSKSIDPNISVAEFDSKFQKIMQNYMPPPPSSTIGTQLSNNHQYLEVVGSSAPIIKSDKDYIEMKAPKWIKSLSTKSKAPSLPSTNSATWSETYNTNNLQTVSAANYVAAPSTTGSSGAKYLLSNNNFKNACLKFVNNNNNTLNNPTAVSSAYNINQNSPALQAMSNAHSSSVTHANANTIKTIDRSKVNQSICPELHYGLMQHSPLKFAYTHAASDDTYLDKSCVLPRGRGTIFTPTYYMTVNRLHSNARRFITLNLGSVCVVTDIIIPAFDKLQSITIHTGLVSSTTNDNSMDLLVTSRHIATNPLILTNIQPVLLAQYIQIMITARPNQSAMRVKINLGCLYGRPALFQWEIMPGINNVTVANRLQCLLPSYHQFTANYSQSCATMTQLLTQLIDTQLCGSVIDPTFTHNTSAHQSASINRFVQLLGQIHTLYQQCTMHQLLLSTLSHQMRYYQAVLAPSNQATGTINKTFVQSSQHEQHYLSSMSYNCLVIYMEALIKSLVLDTPLFNHLEYLKSNLEKFAPIFNTILLYGSISLKKLLIYWIPVIVQSSRNDPNETIKLLFEVWLDRLIIDTFTNTATGTNASLHRHVDQIYPWLMLLLRQLHYRLGRSNTTTTAQQSHQAYLFKAMLSTINRIVPIDDATGQTSAVVNWNLLIYVLLLLDVSIPSYLLNKTQVNKDWNHIFWDKNLSKESDNSSNKQSDFTTSSDIKFARTRLHILKEQFIKLNEYKKKFAEQMNFKSTDSWYTDLVITQYNNYSDKIVVRINIAIAKLRRVLSRKEASNTTSNLNDSINNSRTREHATSSATVLIQPTIYQTELTNAINALMCFAGESINYHIPQHTYIVLCMLLGKLITINGTSNSILSANPTSTQKLIELAYTSGGPAAEGWALASCCAMHALKTVITEIVMVELNALTGSNTDTIYCSTINNNNGTMDDHECLVFQSLKTRLDAMMRNKLEELEVGEIADLNGVSDLDYFKQAGSNDKSILGSSQNQYHNSDGDDDVEEEEDADGNEDDGNVGQDGDNDDEDDVTPTGAETSGIYLQSMGFEGVSNKLFPGSNVASGDIDTGAVTISGDEQMDEEEDDEDNDDDEDVASLIYLNQIPDSNNIVGNTVDSIALNTGGISSSDGAAWSNITKIIEDSESDDYTDLIDDLNFFQQSSDFTPTYTVSKVQLIPVYNNDKTKKSFGTISDPLQNTNNSSNVQNSSSTNFKSKYGFMMSTPYMTSTSQSTNNNYFSPMDTTSNNNNSKSYSKALMGDNSSGNQSQNGALSDCQLAVNSDLFSVNGSANRIGYYDMRLQSTIYFDQELSYNQQILAWQQRTINTLLNNNGYSGNVCSTNETVLDSADNNFKSNNNEPARFISQILKSFDDILSNEEYTDSDLNILEMTNLVLLIIETLSRGILIMKLAGAVSLDLLLSVTNKLSNRISTNKHMLLQYCQLVRFTVRHNTDSKATVDIMDFFSNLLLLTEKSDRLDEKLIDLIGSIFKEYMFLEPLQIYSLVVHVLHKWLQRLDILASIKSSTTSLCMEQIINQLMEICSEGMLLWLKTQSFDRITEFVHQVVSLMHVLIVQHTTSQQQQQHTPTCSTGTDQSRCFTNLIDSQAWALLQSIELLCITSDKQTYHQSLFYQRDAVSIVCTLCKIVIQLITDVDVIPETDIDLLVSTLNQCHSNLISQEHNISSTSMQCLTNQLQTAFAQQTSNTAGMTQNQLLIGDWVWLLCSHIMKQESWKSSIYRVLSNASCNGPSEPLFLLINQVCVGGSCLGSAVTKCLLRQLSTRGWLSTQHQLSLAARAATSAASILLTDFASTSINFGQSRVNIAPHCTIRCHGNDTSDSSALNSLLCSPSATLAVTNNQAQHHHHHHAATSSTIANNYWTYEFYPHEYCVTLYIQLPCMSLLHKLTLTAPNIPTSSSSSSSRDLPSSIHVTLLRHHNSSSVMQQVYSRYHKPNLSASSSSDNSVSVDLRPAIFANHIQLRLKRPSTNSRLTLSRISILSITSHTDSRFSNAHLSNNSTIIRCLYLLQSPHLKLIECLPEELATTKQQLIQILMQYSPDNFQSQTSHTIIPLISGIIPQFHLGNYVVEIILNMTQQQPQNTITIIQSYYLLSLLKENFSYRSRILEHVIREIAHYKLYQYPSQYYNLSQIIYLLALALYNNTNKSIETPIITGTSPNWIEQLIAMIDSVADSSHMSLGGHLSQLNQSGLALLTALCSCSVDVCARALSDQSSIRIIKCAALSRLGCVHFCSALMTHINNELTQYLLEAQHWERTIDLLGLLGELCESGCVYIKHQLVTHSADMWWAQLIEHITQYSSCILAETSLNTGDNSSISFGAVNSRIKLVDAAVNFFASATKCYVESQQKFTDILIQVMQQYKTNKDHNVLSDGLRELLLRVVITQPRYPVIFLDTNAATSLSIDKLSQLSLFNQHPELTNYLLTNHGHLQREYVEINQHKSAGTNQSTYISYQQLLNYELDQEPLFNAGFIAIDKTTVQQDTEVDNLKTQDASLLMCFSRSGGIKILGEMLPLLYGDMSLMSFSSALSTSTNSDNSSNNSNNNHNILSSINSNTIGGLYSEIASTTASGNFAYPLDDHQTVHPLIFKQQQQLYQYNNSNTQANQLYTNQIRHLPLLPSYCLPLLALIMQLDETPTILLQHPQSNVLLRLLLGCTSSNNVTSASPNAASTVPSSVGSLSQLDEHIQLLPLQLLTEIMENCNATQETLDTTFRHNIMQKMVSLGILDFLLSLLAIFGHLEHSRTNKYLGVHSALLIQSLEDITQQLFVNGSSPNKPGVDNKSDMASATNTYAYKLPYSVVAGKLHVINSSSVNPEEKKNYWAKGTGFGTGAMYSAWDTELVLAKLKFEEAHSTAILVALSRIIFPGINSTTATPPPPAIELPATVVNCLIESPMMSYICSHLRNDSVLDISQHVPLYKAILALVRSLANQNCFYELLFPRLTGPRFVDQHDTSTNGNITQLLTQLKICVDTYINRLKRLPNIPNFKTKENPRKLTRQNSIRRKNGSAFISAQQKLDTRQYLPISMKNTDESKLPWLSSSNTASSAAVGGTSNSSVINSSREESENISQLLPDINDTVAILTSIEAQLISEKQQLQLNKHQNAGSSDKNHLLDDTNDLAARSNGDIYKLTTLHDTYTKTIKTLQFGMYEMIKQATAAEGSQQQLHQFGVSNLQFTVPYHYKKEVEQSRQSNLSTNTAQGGLARARRLAQETVTLSTSLPLSYSSSVCVRCDDNHLDVMKVLIIGPPDTPYANGCFEFDVFFPQQYPKLPPLINLSTTGGGTVRFNPNLYNDGKVCLSILNTWHGRPEERWNSKTSSFLQILVSIQSLILVSEPYFNEPGYERSRGTKTGNIASQTYSANIRAATARWAILEQLRNPSACFASVIRTHFRLKHHEIIDQLQSWIDSYSQPSQQQAGAAASASTTADQTSIVNNASTNRPSIATSLANLKKYMVLIKKELDKLQSEST